MLAIESQGRGINLYCFFFCLKSFSKPFKIVTTAKMKKTVPHYSQFYMFFIGIDFS